MTEHTLYGFWVEYTSYDRQFFCELEENNHGKALLFYFNGNCRSIDLTGRESLFVEDLIACGVNKLEKIYAYLDVETIYRTGWNIDISYDDQHIISCGGFEEPDNLNAFCHCMNRWMYKNGGITEYTWDFIQNNLTV